MSTPGERLSEGFWDRIKEFFKGIWVTFWETPADITNPFFSSLGGVLSAKVGEQTITYLNESMVKSINALDIPLEIKTTILNVIKDGDLGSLLLGYLTTFSYHMSYIGGHAAVAGELASHAWRKQYRPSLPDVASLIMSVFRDPSRTVEIRDLLAKHGFTDGNIDTLLKAAKSIYNPDEVRQLYLRGQISEPELRVELKKYGFNDGEIDNLKLLYEIIPAPSDLVRMAVREAFDPDYIARFNTMAEYPIEFEQFAAKQGITSEWAQKFWAAHWEIPSVLQGFEMLHRDVIEDSELDDLLFARDIMPWWREKLKHISYKPLTRVDVRRVYRMGIITREQVLRTYLDLGYNDEKAEWLTRFTEMEQGEKERDLTKAEILSAYGKGIIDLANAKPMLTDLGYSEIEVDVLISVKDYQDIKQFKEHELARIKKMYLASVYSANQAISELGKLDLSGAEQNAQMKIWDRDKEAQLKSPSKGDLDKLFAGGIINRESYAVEMQGLGYQVKHINWFLALLEKPPSPS